jgi:RNA polymerase sigma factor (sigma-70 family)
MVELQTNDFSQLLKQYEGMIYSIINRLGVRDPHGEFFQEGAIALWKATKTYDASRGVFSSYAYSIIRGALMNLITKRNHINETVERYKLYAPIEARRTQNLEETFIDPYLIQKAKSILTENQWKWFQMFVLEDRSIKEIAEKENVTEEAVKNWGRYAREKIRRLLMV